MRVRLLLSGALVLGLAPASVRASENAFDACGLLTRAELQTIQEGKLRQAKPSRHDDGVLSVSQCFYDIEPFPKSVSVDLTRSEGDAADPSAVRARWERLFPISARSKPEKDAREPGEKESEPRPVAGLGEQAFWEPSRVGGALSVFQKNAIVRIAVGGAESDDARLERSKKLARKALKRL